MVDTRDLKSLGQQCPCEFESHPRHLTKGRNNFAWYVRKRSLHRPPQGFDRETCRGEGHHSDARQRGCARAVQGQLLQVETGQQLAVLLRNRRTPLRRHHRPRERRRDGLRRRFQPRRHNLDGAHAIGAVAGRGGRSRQNGSVLSAGRRREGPQGPFPARLPLLQRHAHGLAARTGPFGGHQRRQEGLRQGFAPPRGRRDSSAPRQGGQGDRTD